jgi:hypothetical protein
MPAWKVADRHEPAGAALPESGGAGDADKVQHRRSADGDGDALQQARTAFKRLISRQVLQQFFMQICKPGGVGCQES